MANFTMTLQEILENNPNEDLGLSLYPIFDEAYRTGLNQKIFNEYYNREIGSETVQEFRLWMHRRMCKIMPYYNQLYLSEKLKIDPLNTVDMSTVIDTTENATTHGVMTGESTSTGSTTEHGETTGESTSTGNVTQETSANSKARTVDMQTPQNELASQGDYATGAQDSISSTDGSSTSANNENSSSGTTSDSTGTSSGSSDSTSTGDTQANTAGHVENKTKGYTGSQALLLSDFRKTFLNIDAEIIDELATLFMQVWTTGDSFTQHERGTHYGYYSRYWL